MATATHEEYYKLADGYMSYKNELDSYLNDSHSHYNSYCKAIITSVLGNNLGYIQTCVAFLKYSDNLKQDEFLLKDNVPCEYFNIWFKEQLRNIPNNIYDVSEFYNILNSHHQSKQFVNDLCVGKIKDIDDSLFKNFQFLHNLYYNLNIYQSISEEHDELSYCNSATKCRESYETEVSNCTSTNPSLLCKELMKFKEQYNSEMQIKEKCPNIEKKILSYPGHEDTAQQLESRDSQSAFQTRSASRGEDSREVGSSEPNSIHDSIVIPVSVILLISFLFLIFYKVYNNNF
ncbi:PIR protein [Plasmodium ovale]|uniref:PIR protein n=1 Tax=Plasmodium ovale TaxID=36330 RepID=A0A1C3KHI3_PLAOA|nr:PIR protein [Plasmodium ovale]